jgi:cation-transporting ATPase 13A2
MSVIARSSLAEGYFVYAKGSPEMMLSIMKRSSVPKNYNEMLREYASHGFRVLAIASKPISEDSIK